MPAPAAGDEDAYIWIDHREAEDTIVEMVSERLDAEDALRTRFDGDDLYFVHRGQEHHIPLAQSMHDRYIAISSLAMILRERYNFLLLQETLDDDTHGLLVARKDEAARWGGIPEHLCRLELGRDYFDAENLAIPYLGNLNNNPHFAADRVQRIEGRQAANEAIDAWLWQELKTNPELRRVFAATRKLGRPWWKFW
jgi:hypothetical protein